jgi:hypothetical protein
MSAVTDSSQMTFLRSVLGKSRRRDADSGNRSPKNDLEDCGHEISSCVIT